jgi:hypothetical protein
LGERESGRGTGERPLARDLAKREEPARIQHTLSL